VLVSFSRSVFAFIYVYLQLELDIDAYQAAKECQYGARGEAPIDIFERIENFFKCLETYTEVPPTAAMTDIIVKIMVKVLNFFAIAAKEIRPGRTSDLPICLRLNLFYWTLSRKVYEEAVGKT
jgi:hypothetical protein